MSGPPFWGYCDLPFYIMVSSSCLWSQSTRACDAVLSRKARVQRVKHHFSSETSFNTLKKLYKPVPVCFHEQLLMMFTDGCLHVLTVISLYPWKSGNAMYIVFCTFAHLHTTLSILTTYDLCVCLCVTAAEHDC